MPAPLYLESRDKPLSEHFQEGLTQGEEPLPEWATPSGAQIGCGLGKGRAAAFLSPFSATGTYVFGLPRQTKASGSHVSSRQAWSTRLLKDPASE